MLNEKTTTDEIETWIASIHEGFHNEIANSGMMRRRVHRAAEKAGIRIRILKLSDDVAAVIHMGKRS